VPSNLECSRKKVVGEPDEGKPHVRFDVAGDGNQGFSPQAQSLDPTSWRFDCGSQNEPLFRKRLSTVLCSAQGEGAAGFYPALHIFIEGFLCALCVSVVRIALRPWEILS